MKRPERQLEEELKRLEKQLEEEFWAAQLRVLEKQGYLVYRPREVVLKLLESELEERHARVEKFHMCNEARKNKATADYQVYCDIGRRLIDRNPRLRNAGASRVAELVRKELKDPGIEPPSKRTIERAFKQKSLKV